MSNLPQRYSIKCDRMLKRICSPLKEHLGFSVFEFYRIDTDGNFSILSTYAEQLDFYYSEKLYLYEPYLRHPDFFRSGYTVIPAVADSHYQEISVKRYNLNDMLLKLENKGDCIEGFLFATTDEQGLLETNYLSRLDLLNQFISYFKKEAKTLIDQIISDPFDLKEAKGPAFFSDSTPNLPLSVKNIQESDFRDSILPLSKRELQCLELYKNGNTAQATAAILGISQRTVEYYYNNIKRKLNLSSKFDLLRY